MERRIGTRLLRVLPGYTGDTEVDTFESWAIILKNHIASILEMYNDQNQESTIRRLDDEVGKDRLYAWKSSEAWEKRKKAAIDKYRADKNKKEDEEKKRSNYKIGKDHSK